MESRKVKRPDSLDVQKMPMITTGAVGAPINCGAAAVQGEATRLGLQPTKLPNGRKLFSFEQAEMIIRSIMRRDGSRV